MINIVTILWETKLSPRIDRNSPTLRPDTKAVMNPDNTTVKIIFSLKIINKNINVKIT